MEIEPTLGSYRPPILVRSCSAIGSEARTSGGLSATRASIDRLIAIGGSRSEALTSASGLNAYDHRNRLARSDALGGTVSQSYGHDGFGNLVSVTDAQGTRTFAAELATNRLAAASYDSRGNLTSWGGFSHEWRVTGEMRRRTGPGLDNWYAYDGGGQRVLRDGATYHIRHNSSRRLNYGNGKDGARSNSPGRQRVVRVVWYVAALLVDRGAWCGRRHRVRGHLSPLMGLPWP